MNSGTAAGAVKPKQPMAFQAPDVDWLRASDSHDVQGTVTYAHNRTNTRLQPLSAFLERDPDQTLQEERISSH